jgi:hypothetical protein
MPNHGRSVRPAVITPPPRPPSFCPPPSLSSSTVQALAAPVRPHIKRGWIGSEVPAKAKRRDAASRYRERVPGLNHPCSRARCPVALLCIWPRFVRGQAAGCLRTSKQRPGFANVQKRRVVELEAQLKQQQSPPWRASDGAEAERLRAVLRAVQAMVSLPGV